MIDKPPFIPDDIAECIRKIIVYIGDDPTRDGLRETPHRVMRAFDEMFAGYRQDPDDVFKVFDAGCTADEIVLLKDIPWFSHCEHHMLPFSGVAHIAYVPRGNRIIGVSKLVRLLEIFTKRLQVQERITAQVTWQLMSRLDPIGAACVLEAEHQCMTCRGVKKGGIMVTSNVMGCFREKPEARQELFNLIRG